VALGLGVAVAGAALLETAAGMLVIGTPISAMSLALVSTVGTMRKHNPTRPNAMIPATSPIALRRRFAASPVAADASERMWPG